MSIGIYTAASPGTLISKAHAFTNPFTIALDGKIGGIIQKKLYVRNDDVTLWYSGITVTPVNIVDATTVNGSTGMSWKLSAGNTQPFDDAWSLITAANTISLANIGSLHVNDTTTYLPFWVRIQIPRNTEVKSITDVTLDISASENLVT